MKARLVASAEMSQMSLLWIALGGGIGTLGRYGISLALKGSSEAIGFPFATLLVNLVGCLLIGFFASSLSQETSLAATAKTVVLVGVLGGFTTFSSFGLETLHLIRGGQVGFAALYVVASNLGGLALAWLGFQMGEG